jgi:hypothetical protein
MKEDEMKKDDLVELTKNIELISGYTLYKGQPARLVRKVGNAIELKIFIVKLNKYELATIIGNPTKPLLKPIPAMTLDAEYAYTKESNWDAVKAGLEFFEGFKRIPNG